MIQRKQTVYLFFVIVLFVIMFFSKIATGSLINNQTYSITTLSLYPLIIFASLSILLSIGAIATFKKSTLQLRLSIVNMVMICGFIIMEAHSIYRFFNIDIIALTEKKIEIAGFLPVVALVFAFLAFKGIYRDILLIRSYDRMR